MKFTKMHGLGNDYVMLDATKNVFRNLNQIAKNLCDRKFGVGSDGIILILKSKSADFRMRMFNPDGTEAEMCGNGIRCMAEFIWSKSLTNKKTINIETIAGTKILSKISNDLISVNMGTPIPLKKSQYKFSNGVDLVYSLEFEKMKFKGFACSMGNPHCVILVNDIQSLNIEKFGPIIEKFGFFPSRTNVEFVQIISKNLVKQRTWERGAKETLACATGACAVLLSLYKQNLIENKITIKLSGGSLLVEYKDNQIWMSGPAITVFEGEVQHK